MKKSKILLIGLFVMMVLTVLVGCKGDDEEPIDPVDVVISLNQTTVTLQEGDSFTLIASVEGSEELVSWTSSNEDVVTVDDGVLEAVSAGTATVRAAIGDISASATITVESNPFPVLTVSQDQVELVIGTDGITVVPTLTFDEETVSATFNWSVEDDGVATVSSQGLIEAVGVGETVVTVSTTYEGDYVEKDITVIVNINAQLVLSENEVVLDAIDVDGTQEITQSIDLTAFINDAEVTGQVFVAESDDTFASFSVDGSILTIDADLPGDMDINVYFMYEGVKVSSVVNVIVNYVEVELDHSFNVDLSAEQPGMLDFTDVTLLEAVNEIIYDGEVISTDTDGQTLKAEFVDLGVIGDVKDIQVVTDRIIYTSTLKFINSYVDIEMFLPEAGNGSTYEPYTGDETALGFADGTEVFEYYTGTVASAWESRLQTNQPLSGYDYWMMDFVLTEPLEGSITLWIGMFHVVLVNPSGQASLLQPGGNFDGDQLNYDSVKVYDQDGLRQLSELQANVVYTLEINLQYRDADPRDSFGVAASTTLYLANIYGASQSYYDENVGERTEPALSTYAVTLDITSDNNVGATYTYNQTIEAFEYNTGTTTNSWANRLQTTDPQVRNYDYMFFNIMLSETLTNPVNFWMDMLNVTTLSPDGSKTQEGTLWIIDSNDTVVTGALNANEIYTVIAKLVHADEEGRYAFGFNQDTMMYINGVFVATQSYFDTYMADVSVPLPETQTITLGLTADNNVGATFTYNESIEAFEYNTGTSTSSWANRLQTTDELIPNYDYMFFNVMLSAPLTQPVNFWMDMLAVTTLNADGSKSQANTLYIINSNQELVTGAMNANEIYTIAIKLSHADEEGRYAFGFNEDTMMYINGVFVATQSYFDTFIASLNDPVKEAFDVTLSLTADNNVSATYDLFTGDQVALGFDSADVVYVYDSGVSTSPWANRLQTQEADVKGLDVFMFDMVLGEALTSDIIFWMDMLSVTTLYSDGTRNTNDLLYIFDASGNLVTGALAANQVYTFAIVLSHGDEEGRYALGFNESLTLYLANIKAVDQDVLNDLLA